MNHAAVSLPLDVNNTEAFFCLFGMSTKHMVAVIEGDSARCYMQFAGKHV